MPYIGQSTHSLALLQFITTETAQATTVILGLLAASFVWHMLHKFHTTHGSLIAVVGTAFVGAVALVLAANPQWLVSQVQKEQSNGGMQQLHAPAPGPVAFSYVVPDHLAHLAPVHRAA